MNKIQSLLVCLLNVCVGIAAGAPTIFVPRQLSYNPIFENAISCSSKVYDQDRSSYYHKSDHAIFSAKPIFTQNIGSKFAQYFTIDNKPVLNVQENGTGDISSLWFQVVAPTGYFYASDLSFDPVRTTFGSMLYAQLNITDKFSISANTALITTRNSMHISEKQHGLLGEVAGWQTIIQAFSNPDMQYGAINGTQSKTGVDDIQVKFIYHSYSTKNANYDMLAKVSYELYLLAGVPTGQGSQAQYLFEPLVGSHHAQVGLGGNLHYKYETFKFQAEAKWRYAFTGDEMRSFDLTKNGQWSRYLLVVNSLNTYSPYPAINNFTFLSQVTPQNSFDLYLAAYWDPSERWHVELGYDFWFRQAEKISVSPVFPQPSLGIADLYNVIFPTLAHPAESASTANISQGVVLGQNTVPSDTTFIALQAIDLNLASAGAPQSISNSIYGSIAYTKEMHYYIIRSGFGLAYECGHGVNVPNNITAWMNFDLLF